MKPRRSIRRRLALAALALVSAVVAAISAVSYREVRTAALNGARAHVDGVAGQLADILGSSTPSVLGQLTAIAEDPAVVAQLRSTNARGDSARGARGDSVRGARGDSVLAVASRRSAPATAAVSVFELWDTAGRTVAATRHVPALPVATAQMLIASVSGRRDSRVFGANAAIGPITRDGDSLSYQVIASVLDGDGGRRLGYAVQRRRVTITPQATAQLQGLIGPESRLLVGNSDGGLWTNLVSAVTGPPPGVLNAGTRSALDYRRADGEDVLAATAPIVNTPWSVLVESPRRLALEPAHSMLWRLGTLMLVLLAAAAAGAWVFSRELTRPIAQLADAAKAISAGNYSKRLSVEWRDELGTFATAFNEMAEQISRTLASLRHNMGELKEAEARHRLLFEASPQPMWVYDVETGRFLAVNDAAVERYGYSRDAFLSMTIMDIRPQGEVPALLENLADLSASARPQSAVWRHRRAGGQLIDVEINSRPLLLDNRPARLVLINDLTEQRQVEAEAARSRERLERVLGASAAVLLELRLEPAGPVLEWISDNLAAVLGYTPDEAYAGQWWNSNVHPNDRPRLTESLRTAAPQNQINEYRFRAKTGAYRWIREEQRWIVDPMTGKTKIVAAWLDVTARRNLESQLQHAQKMEAVGRLAGGLAHDFNNLLTVMLAECQYMETEPDVSAAERGESLAEIRRAAERAALLTRQLLTFSRKQFVELAPIDLNDVVSHTEKMLRRVIGEDIDVRVNLAAVPVTTMADRTQVEQIILNLAVNARDAMPNGGTLTVETALLELDESYCMGRQLKAGRYIRLAVSDTGVGMSEEVQSHVFEPFFTTKDAGKGTGLGLATCYAIARQFGGHIGVYSEVGIGTTMNVYLPSLATAAVDATAEHPVAEPGGTETVLLVEDDPGVRRSTARMLTAKGYVVLQAADAMEALALVDRHEEREIHLLLTDVVLPKIGGRELAEAVTKKRPDIRVLFMSGYSVDAVLQHRLTEKHALLLQKPFTSRALAEKVRSALAAVPV
jgi:PAS domain S-box-containing protein